MIEAMRRLVRGKPKYSAELVGMRTGTRYPYAFGRFYSREEGEQWISERPSGLEPPLYRWELVER